MQKKKNAFCVNVEICLKGDSGHILDDVYFISPCRNPPICWIAFSGPK